MNDPIAAPLANRNINPSVFPGTDKEKNDLLQALSHNCACKKGLMGMLLERCAPHDGLVNDERWITGLLFARRVLILQMQVEEWTVEGGIQV